MGKRFLLSKHVLIEFQLIPFLFISALFPFYFGFAIAFSRFFTFVTFFVNNPDVCGKNKDDSQKFSR